MRPAPALSTPSGTRVRQFRADGAGFHIYPTFDFQRLSKGGASSRRDAPGSRRGERMKIAVLTGAVAAALMMSPAQGAVRIKADPGGQIGPYLENLVALRGSGERVIIDGPCLSACTLVLGVIPRERICVTSRARLGFHAAWHPGDNGQTAPSRGGAPRCQRPADAQPRRAPAPDGSLPAAGPPLARAQGRPHPADEISRGTRT